MSKTTTAICLAITLALGVNTAAQAEHRHHRGGYDRPDYRHHDRDHHRHHRSSWVGPAAVLAIAGLTVGAIAYHQSQPAAIVYSTPPAPAYPPPPEAGYWRYCGSAGQYYPYVRYCPEGWQAVPQR